MPGLLGSVGPGWFLLLRLLVGWIILTGLGPFFLSLSKRFGMSIWSLYMWFIWLLVRLRLHHTCIEDPDVDLAWYTWSCAAEHCLLQALKAACGPCPQGPLPLPFVVRGKALFRTRLVGGRAPGKGTTRSVACSLI